MTTIILGANSSIWTQLTLPNPPSGSIPFVWTDNETIAVSTDFAYYLGQLLLGTAAAAQTMYGGSFMPPLMYIGPGYRLSTSLSQALAPHLALGQISLNGDDQALAPGIHTTVFRGSATVPLKSSSGDMAGHFTGNASLNTADSSLTYITSIFSAVKGVLGWPGGELHFQTKADSAVAPVNPFSGALVDRMILDNTGALKPTTAGVAGSGALAAASSRLGIANQGFGALSLDYGISGVNGAVTINKPAGQVSFAAAAQSLVLTNSLITANSIVIATVATDDATGVSVKAIPAAGSCTIKLNAAATATTKVNFLVIGTDS